MEQLATDTVYSVADLWCAAVAADRINEGYVKKTNYGSDQQTNRTMVRLMLLNSSGWSYGDMQLAYQYHQYWRNQMLLLLDDNANEYAKLVAKISSQETIGNDDVKSMAVIASAVHSTRDRLFREKLNKQKQQCDRDYVAAVSEKINVAAQVINCRMVERIGAYCVEAIANGRYLIQWWKDQPVPAGTVVDLWARVKSHTTDYHTKVPTTQVNYTRYQIETSQ